MGNKYGVFKPHKHMHTSIYYTNTHRVLLRMFTTLGYIFSQLKTVDLWCGFPNLHPLYKKEVYKTCFYS